MHYNSKRKNLVKRMLSALYKINKVNQKKTEK